MKWEEILDRLADSLIEAANTVSQHQPERIVYSGVVGTFLGSAGEIVAGAPFILGFALGFVVVNVRVVARLIRSDGIHDDSVTRALDQIDSYERSGGSRADAQRLRWELCKELIRQAKVDREPVRAEPVQRELPPSKAAEPTSE